MLVALPINADVLLIQRFARRRRNLPVQRGIIALQRNDVQNDVQMFRSANRGSPMPPHRGRKTLVLN